MRVPILRDYQIDISQKACDILKEKHIVYLAMQVRTGKTLTALNTAMLFGANNVLFLTKKKAIDSIIKDYNEFGYTFNLNVINDEQIEKLDTNYDLIIHDEHHRFGAFPKPSKRVQLFNKMYGNKPMIFLSGTPAAESYSQMYHQFWVSNRSLL
jgi:superfamily II DNA or RNA helicase